MPSRVLFVSYTADWTGPTNSLWLLLGYLREQYDVAVLLPGHGLFSDKLTEAGIPFHSLPALNRQAIPAMWRLIRSGQFDVVYGNSTHGSSRNALIAAKLARVPVIVHVREMGWGKTWRQMGFLRLADSVVAVSQACAESIKRFVKPGRLHVVYNGVPLDGYTFDREADRAYVLGECGLPPDSVVVVSLGHLCARKGQLYGVEALAQAVQHAPNIHLLLIGSLDRDAAYVEHVRTRIREGKLDERITLLGFRQDVMRLLSGSDILLHTAERDPHPRAVIEAMAAGLPVVGFATDGVSESVLSGETGLLVLRGDVRPLAENLLALVTDSETRTQMGDAGARLARRRFSAATTADQIGAVIDHVLEK